MNLFEAFRVGFAASLLLNAARGGGTAPFLRLLDRPPSP